MQASDRIGYAASIAPWRSRSISRRTAAGEKIPRADSERSERTSSTSGLQRARHPLPKRNAEPGFSGGRSRRAEESLPSPFERPTWSSGRAACRRRAGARRAHHLVVEQRHAHLDAVRHAHLVGVVEVVVRQKEFRVQVQHLVERAASPTAARGRDRAARRRSTGRASRSASPANKRIAVARGRASRSSWRCARRGVRCACAEHLDRSAHRRDVASAFAATARAARRAPAAEATTTPARAASD